jgi:hypothetical protein
MPKKIGIEAKGISRFFSDVRVVTTPVALNNDPATKLAVYEKHIWNVYEHLQ